MGGKYLDTRIGLHLLRLDTTCTLSTESTTNADSTTTTTTMRIITTTVLTTTVLTTTTTTITTTTTTPTLTTTTTPTCTPISIGDCPPTSIGDCPPTSIGFCAPPELDRPPQECLRLLHIPSRRSTRAKVAETRDAEQEPVWGGGLGERWGGVGVGGEVGGGLPTLPT